MAWNIEYPYTDVEEFLSNLAPGLLARYHRLSELLIEFGAYLGMPHTKALCRGLFELRIKGKEGIVRIFYCTLVRKRIVMLHVFTKKTQKTPLKELQKAERRYREVVRRGS
ncbi:MAG TPA: type II toxin-antitoxin system RelE/ParE family toxin [Gammaproteobacteria bacterium]|jgi:phage-related protein|nr:type II toxin-antitoxin system RelE/ParE family toxin [Gammaproteobacteria bacterium]